MTLHGYCKWFWFTLVLHKYDGFLAITKPIFMVRVGFLTFGFNKYFQSNEECYESDSILYNFKKRAEERSLRIANAIEEKWPFLYAEGYDLIEAAQIIRETK